MQAPLFWHVMFEQLFRVHSRKMREQLWQAFPASQALRYQLDLCGTLAPSGVQAGERVRHLAALITPKDLLATAQKLAVPGRTRPAAVREFEETVLRLTDKNGGWKWN
jgi:hypothetical protein